MWARVGRVISCCVYRPGVGFRALSSARVLQSMYDAVKHAPGRSFFFFCYRPGACFWLFLASGPYLGSVVPFWLALALVRAGSSACVLSLCPAGLSGLLWPVFGLCLRPVSSTCVLRAFLGRSGPCLGCVLSLCPAGLSGSLWPLFGLRPRLESSACFLQAFLGRSGPHLGCVLSPRPQLVSYHH